MKTCAKRAKRFEKDLDYSGVKPSRSKGSHYLFPFNACLSPSYTSPFPCSSLLSKCCLFILPFDAILKAIHPPCSRPQEIPSNPWHDFCYFVYASACTNIKTEKDFSFPFLSAPNYMRHLSRRKVKRLSKCRPACFL